MILTLLLTLLIIIFVLSRSSNPRTLAMQKADALLAQTSRASVARDSIEIDTKKRAEWMRIGVQKDSREGQETRAKIEITLEAIEEGGRDCGLKEKMKRAVDIIKGKGLNVPVEKLVEAVLDVIIAQEEDGVDVVKEERVDAI